VGESHNSYLYRDEIWALAVDTAAQVSANRHGAKLRVPPFWDQVLRDASSGRVLWPYKPVDAFSTFATLLAQLGKPLARREETLNIEAARAALDLMIALARAVPDWCATANPIDIAEALANGEDYDYAVALFGYTNYSRTGFRKHLLQYEDIPSFDGRATGSELGGAGIAVSATTQHAELCGQIASFLAGAEAQAGLYGLGGGQPGNLIAWLDPELNAATSQFFRHTLRTLERAWVRPRVLGWPDYQLALSLVVHRILVNREYSSADLSELQGLPDLHLQEELP
jgi:multiple sugar transport system substrate-binding protein